MRVTLNGREASVDVCIEKHHCDSYFESGYWLDNDQECTDQELSDLTDANADALCEYCMEECGTWID